MPYDDNNGSITVFFAAVLVFFVVVAAWMVTLMIPESAENRMQNELDEAAELRLELISNKILEKNKNEGTDELYRMLINPEFFGSYEDYTSLMMSEDTDLEVYQDPMNLHHDCLDINHEITVQVYKQKDGTYFAEASLGWIHPDTVAERFVKAVKAGDQDMVFQCLTKTKDIEDGKTAIRKLQESGDYDRILKIKNDRPDGISDFRTSDRSHKIVGHFGEQKYIATFTLQDGTYYDICLSDQKDTGIKVDQFTKPPKTWTYGSSTSHD